MSGTLERSVDGVWFSVEDQRSRLLSPLQCSPRCDVILMVALHPSSDDICRHQDGVNSSPARGRLGFARRCEGLDAQVVAQDLLALDAAVCQALDRHEAYRPAG